MPFIGAHNSIMADANSIEIEVAFARVDVQVVLQLTVPRKTSVGAAIRRSGILARFPDIDLTHHQVGIFGHIVPVDHPVEAGDRVEIYRPLTVSAKEARRRRAGKK